MRDKFFRVIATSLLLLFLISILSYSLTDTSKNEIFQTNLKEDTLKSSKFWNLTGSPISIDDNDPSKNWSYTASHYDWVSGSGNWTDPYVIENVTINGQGLGSCIEIINSSAYFIIKNCTTYNSGTDTYNAGIYLDKTDNGIILDNNCSKNNKGMYLTDCNNITLEYNEFSNNIQFGLFLEECNNNTIINNIANNNDQDGIFISYGNDNNILNNSAMWNNARGIYVFYNKYTLIENNTLNFNNRGLYIGQCEKCFVKNNTLDSNIYFGLYCYMGTNNNISNNYIKDSQEYGIYFSNDKNYNVSSNTLIGCSFYLYGDMDALTSHDIKSTNTVNGKPLYYYVNSEYLNPIDFFNAGQVILINCNNSLIANQNISNVAYGISCLYCVNITVLNNTLSYNNKEGIYFNECKKISIRNNSVSNNYNGVSIINSNYVNVSDNNLLLNEYNGILLSHCFENLIINNSVKNQKRGVGIQISDSVNSTIIDNRFENNIWEAIMLSNNQNVTLRNNKMNNCGLDVNGPLESLITYDIDTSNRVNEKILYYYRNKKYLGESDFVNAGQIFLINCNNSLISNVNLKNCTNGIGLYFSYNNTVLNTNSSYNWGAGIVLLFSNNNSILRNIASNCKTSGILLLFSNNNNITENLVENNGGEGIYGSLALCYGSSNNQIRKNHINNNTIGLILFSTSSNNKISENFFLNNLEHGVSIGDINSDQNMFYNNIFIGNLINAEDNGTNNMWDNGIIGNYWDDYIGEDSNNDGIGDTPYQIQGEAGSVDNLPIWDDQAPIITILSPIGDEVFGIDAPDFVIEIVELYLDTMWYTIDGGITNMTFTENGTISQSAWGALPEGNVIIQFYANDTLGRIGSQEATIKKDSTAPIITIQSPSSDEVLGINAPDFVVEIIELYLDTMWYTIDGGITNITFTENGTISQSAWDALPEGNVVFRFYANDTLGRIGSQEVTVKKDVTAPTITIQSPIGDEVYGINAPDLIVEIIEPYLDTMWYTIDGGITNIIFTENGTISQSAWDALSEGNVAIKFYANDSVGNINFQEVTVVKEITQQSPPGIPGYDLLILVGIISVMVCIIIKKRVNHLTPQ